MKDGSVGLRIVIDRSQLNREILKSRREFNALGDEVVKESRRIESAFSGITQSVVGFAGAWSAKEVVSSLVKIRGEFQQLEVAFSSFLGSEQKASVLMSQITETAAKTPFGLQELASGAKQLLAYGASAEKVNGTLIRLGDIAAGLSMPLGDLVYLYGTTMTQGRLYTQDLNQFLGRGIPMIQGLADVMGVAEREVKGLVEEGKVGFPEVQKVIENLTYEGGKFGGLMEKQSHTIAGQISNIEDAFDMMFNEIGQQNEGVINSALEGTSWLIENYEVVGDTLMTLVATYGVYKASLMALTAYTNAAYNYEATQLRALLADKTATMDADLAGAVAKGRMTSARAAEVQALRAELSAKIENARATSAEADAEAKAATQKRMRAQLEFNLAREAVEAKQQEIDAMEALGQEETANALRNEQDVLVKNMHAKAEALDAAAKDANTAKTKAQTAAQTVNTLQTQRDTVAKKLNGTQTKLLTVLTNGLKKAINSLKAAWASNPVGLILMGVTMVAGALMTLGDATESASFESTKFGEAAAKTARQIDMLFAVIDATNNKSKVHGDALDELIKIYEDAGIHIDHERDLLAQLNAEREKAIGLIKAEGEERDKANNIAAYNEAIASSAQSMKDKLLEQLKVAELEGSGVFDDWDADATQKRAAEITKIIGSIFESEADEIAKIADVAEREKRITETLDKAAEAYMNIMGYNEKSKEHGVSVGFDKLDVKWEEILTDYVDKIGDLTSARDKLSASYKEGENASKKEAEAIDYTTLSFDDLFKATMKVDDNLNDIDNANVRPKIDTTSIRKALTMIDKLAQHFGVAGSLAANIGEKLDSLDTEEDDDETQVTAADELERRMTEAVKTRKDVSKMLKDVNASLDSAIVGSAEEKKLLALQKRLQDAQKRFKGADNANKEAEARKKAEEDAGKQLRKIQQQNSRDEIALRAESHEKKMAQIEQEYNEEKAKIEQQITELAKLNKKAGTTGLNSNGLTPEQQKAVDEALRLATQNRVKSEEELLKESASAMRDYLKEYGSFQQQKLAIAEDYAQRIAKATTEGDKLRLRKERDNALSKMSYESISMGIDWRALLTGVGSLSVEMMKPMLAQLEAYTMTDDYAKADMDEREKVAELILELRRFVGTESNKTWEDLATATQNFEAAVATYRDLEEQERVAYENLATAKEQLAKGEITQADYDKLNATATELSTQTVNAKNEMQSLGNTLNETTEEVKNYVSPLTTALNKLGTWEGVEGFGNVKNNVASIDNLKGSLDTALGGMEEGVGKNIGENLSTVMGDSLSAIGGEVTSLLSTGVGSVIGIIAQIPRLILDMVGNIKGMVTGVLDSLTELISLRWIDDFVVSILDSIGGLIDAIFDLPATLFHVVEAIIVDGVGSLLNKILGRIGNVLSFGLLGSGGPAEWFSGSNAKEVQETIDRLTDRNERLTTAVETLTNEIKQGRGAKSVEEYRKAVELQSEINKNALDIAKAQASYVGSHHSWAYYWEGFTEEEIARVSKQIGRAWDGDLWSLSPDEMELLRSNVDLWERIQNSGKGGYGERLTDELDKYIEQAGKLEELTDALYEGLTGMSFDSMYSNFVDSLMDMEYSAKDAAEDISGYFAKAMLSNKIGEIIGDDLEIWYEKFGKAMEDGMTEEERENLMNEYLGYVEEAEKWRDEIFAATGYGGTSASQDSTKKGFATASQDSVDELNGRFTGIQMSVEAIKNQTGIIIDLTRSQRLDVATMRQHTEELRGLSLSAINHLADISRNTYQLHEMNERLGLIEKHTRKL